MAGALRRRHCVAVLLSLLAAGAGCGGGSDGVAPPPEGLVLAVSAATAPSPYTPGQSYFGRNDYIEYVAGNAPVIYTAAHGGALTPGEIPDRTAGTCGEAIVTSTDLNTADLVRRMQLSHFARFGTYPHVVINNLHRRRLDANRTLAAGACGDAEAELAWQEWHEFIGVARSAILATTGRGWYVDVHGHGHDVQRLELGYGTTAAQLRLTDAVLDATAAYEDTSSIATLSRHSPLGFSALLRGTASLGTLYAAHGFPAVPSVGDPGPAAGEEYFSGGYNTVRYGCGVEASSLGGTAGGSICSVQVEANYTGVRDTPASRQQFADASARVMEQYLGTHWALPLDEGATATIPVARLTWSGSTAATMDVHRNGSWLAAVPNTGVFTDARVTAGSAYTYRVCDAGTSRCSSAVAIGL